MSILTIEKLYQIKAHVIDVLLKQKIFMLRTYLKRQFNKLLKQTHKPTPFIIVIIEKKKWGK